MHRLGALGAFSRAESLDAIRYLQAAFELTSSPVVANRLARVYQTAGDKAKAQHLYALSAALGGGDAEDSQTRLKQLAAAGADEAVKKATGEIASMRAIKLAKASGDPKASPLLHLVFDGTAKPERVDYYGADLKATEQAILNATYPVTFPEMSSVKIVREAALACLPSGCVVELKPAVFPPAN